jgi:uncharacterized protein YcbX
MSVVGRVLELVRYPVKSMAGIPVESAHLGWHGIGGDRRFVFRRVGDASSFPWLSASKLYSMIRYQPIGPNDGEEPVPTHVRTPAGACLELESAELCNELSAQLGSPLELMRLRHGVFDEATVSIITPSTIAGIGREAGLELDRRRFRGNIVVETGRDEPFVEDAWVGGTLMFGDGTSAPAVSVTLRDLRCVMINLDPETAHHDPRVMKTVVRLNRNTAGVYGTVVRTGTIRVGDAVRLI